MPVTVPGKIQLPNRLAQANARRAAIQGKLQAGTINQQQATNRLNNVNAGVRPLANRFGNQLAQRTTNIANKLQAGTINQQQADNRLGRIQGMATQAFPTATNRVSNLQAQYNALGAEDPARQGIADKIGRITGRRGLLNPLTQQQETPPPTTDTPATDTPTTDTPTDPGADATKELDLSALFPNIRAFEPQNYEGSPLYKFQRDEGMKSLERLYAARGLTNSGAELEGNSKFLNELGANEAQRASQIAQLEADRLERMQQNEVLRQERGSDREFNRLSTLLNFALAQSPMDAAYGATNSLAGMVGGFGKDAYGHIKNMAPRISGSSGGGGMPFIPPFPTGPDYSGIDAAQTAAGAGNSGNSWGIVGNTIGSLLGSFL